MTDARPSRFRSLFSELKRRHVFRVAIVYAVVAWAIVQIASTTFPSLTIPDWALTLVIVLAIMGFPLAVVLAWAFETTPEGVQRTPGAAVAPGSGASIAPARPAPPVARKDGPIGSVAVLPFANLSTDPEQEFFSDGMAEELLDALAKIRGLRVPARTSSFLFKGQAVDVREVGARLGVEAVLEGSVRRSADRIRVTAQLVSTEDGYHLWSETYDRTLDDVFRIQEELARSIVDALAVRLPVEAKHELVQQGTTDLEAYTLVLKGRQAFARRDRESMERAIALFEKAIERDAEYPAAHSGLADVLWVGAANGLWPWERVAERARAESERAVTLDPGLAEAHASRGGVLSNDRRWDEAVAAYERAIEISPGYAQVHIWLSSLLGNLWRTEEGLRLARKAASLDPLSRVAVGSVAAMARDRQGDLDLAAEWFEKTLEIDPRYIFAVASIAMIEAERGRFAEARGWANRAVELDERDSFALASLGYVRALAGEREGAMGILDRMHGLGSSKGSEALVWMGLGDSDRALELLEQAADKDPTSMASVIVDRAFQPLWSDPRFHRVLARLELPPPPI